MDLREIAACALDEWENETSETDTVSVSQREVGTTNNDESNRLVDAEDLDFKATASKAVRGAKGLFKDAMSGAGKSGMGNGGVGGAMVDLQKHDESRHGGHFDPETQSCKFREDMAKSLTSMGLMNGQNPEMEAQIKAKIGEKNFNAGASAANKDQKEGKIDAELNEIQNLVKEKNREQDPTKKAELQQKLDSARDAYYKRNLRDAEYNAMKELEQKAKEEPEKVASVAEQIAENPKMGEVQKDAARNLIEKAGGEANYDWDGESGEGAEASASSQQHADELNAKREKERETITNAINSAMSPDGKRRQAETKRDNAVNKALEEFKQDGDAGKRDAAIAKAQEKYQKSVDENKESTSETTTEEPEKAEEPPQTEETVPPETTEPTETTEPPETTEETTDPAPPETEETTEPPETTTEEPVRKTREELKKDAEDARKAFMDAFSEGKSIEELKDLKAKMVKAEKARDKRAETPDPLDLAEDMRNARQALDDAKAKLDDLNSIDPATGNKKGDEQAIADAESEVRHAEEDLKNAEEAALNYEPPQEEETNGGTTGGEATGENGERQREFTIKGKQYVDLSDMGFFEGLQAAFKAGWEGKDIITDWDKMSGRWDQLKASDPKFASSLDALRLGTGGQVMKGGLAKMIEDRLKDKNRSNDEKMALVAAQDALNAGESPQKVQEKLQKAIAAGQKAGDAHTAATNKETRADAESARKQAKFDADEKRRNEKHVNDQLKLGIAPEGVTLTPEQEAYRAHQEESLKTKFTQQQISMAKSGILPDGVDPNSEIGQMAAMQKQKLSDAAEKSRLALEKVQGKQLKKTYAETDPGIIALMEKTAQEMDASGETVMKARAAQIRNTLINTLKTTHDGTDAYNAVHQFKKLLGVNDEGGGKKGEEAAQTITVPGVDHKTGGVTSGDANAQHAAMDTSFLDRSKPMSNGTLAKQTDALNKIVADVQNAGGVQISANDIKVKNGISTTDMTIDLGNNNVNGQAIADAIARGMGRVVGTKTAEGKDKRPVVAKFDPNTNTINLSFQNDTKGTVTFANILDHKDANGKNSWNEFKAKNKGNGAFFLGAKDDGSPDAQSLDKLIHMVIAGQTGAGKSVKEHTVIGSLFEANSPDDLKMILVDPKGTELGMYANDPHVIGEPVTDMNKAAAHMNWLVDENENRAKLFAQAKVRNLNDYNRLGAEGKLPPGLPTHLPRLVMVVDELADLMKTHGKDVDTAIARLSAKARSQGIHLILATQRPDSKVMTGNVKTNIPTTVGMSTKDNVDARVIGIEGLENMQQGGPYAIKTPDGGVSYGEGAFLSDNEINGLVESSKKAYGGGGTPPPAPTNQPPPKNQPPTTPPTGGGGEKHTAPVAKEDANGNKFNGMSDQDLLEHIDGFEERDLTDDEKKQRNAAVRERDLREFGRMHQIGQSGNIEDARNYLRVLANADESEIRALNSMSDEEIGQFAKLFPSRESIERDGNNAFSDLQSWYEARFDDDGYRK